MDILLDVILIILRFYWWVVIVMIIMSWLFAFNVINGRNEFVATIWRIVSALTEPALRPIRRFMPNLGGIDISPLVLFLGIYILERVINEYLRPAVFF